MGIMDKIKNIFAEEVDEEDEIKVEQIKTEVRSVPIESPNVERNTKFEAAQNNLVEEALVNHQETEKAKTPVFFSDRDFADLIAPKKRTEKYEKKEESAKEEKKKGVPSKAYGGQYTSTSIIKKDRPLFKPTPIISPVYGVLDKNYHKEDIVDKSNPAVYVSADGLSVDNIRNKAYGTLEDDLEDAILSYPVDVENVDDENVDFFEDLEEERLEEVEVEELPIVDKKPGKNVKQIEGVTIDLTKELDNLLMKRDRFSDKGEEITEFSENEKESKEEMSESELFDLIDSMYEEGEEE